MTSPTSPLSRRLSRRSLLGGTAALAGGLSLPWLAGCSSGADPGSDAGSTNGDWKAMSWEGQAEMKKWNLHITNFFADYPDMKPSVDYGIEWDQYWTKLQTSIAGGAPTDMCWMHDTRVALYASQGLLEPLDDYLSKEKPQGWSEEFYTTQVEGFQYGGKQYGFPYDWATAGLYVNLDWLEEAGVEVPTEDWTWDDLLAAAVKLKDHAGSPGKQWGMSLPTGSNFGHAIIKAFGGDYVEGDPLTMHFTDEGTVAGFQYLYDAIWKHQAMPNVAQIKGATAGSGDTSAFFASGKVAMMHDLNDTAFVIGDLVKGKFRWTVAPLPKGPAGRFQGVGGSAFSIPKGSAHPDVTYEFIKYALSDPANLPVTAEMGSMFVANTKFWEKGVPSKDVVDPQAYTHAFYELGKTDGDRPLYWPGYGRWDTSVYQKNMDNLWANKTSDVAATLALVQAETEPLLQKK